MEICMILNRPIYHFAIFCMGSVGNDTTTSLIHTYPKVIIHVHFSAGYMFVAINRQAWLVSTLSRRQVIIQTIPTLHANCCNLTMCVKHHWNFEETGEVHMRNVGKHGWTSLTWSCICYYRSWPLWAFLMMRNLTLNIYSNEYPPWN